MRRNYRKVRHLAGKVWNIALPLLALKNVLFFEWLVTPLSMLQAARATGCPIYLANLPQ